MERVNGGLFIVLYGPEGVGKETQAKLLEEKMRSHGCLLVRRVRYPVYEQKPSGLRLDEIFHRHSKKMPEEEMQRLFAQNRKEFEPTLKSWLSSGVCVIAENYRGTGIVWGVVRGMSVDQIEDINRETTVEPDVCVVVDGPRREETLGGPYGEDEEWYKSRKMYLVMAGKYGWVKVGADAPILTVANRVWAVVRPVVMSRV